MAARTPISFAAGLGLYGIDTVEPLLLAALISEEPLLLIGTHGVGKSLLLLKLAEALELDSRHYNASMVNFDDLVGFPVPDGRGGLDYLRTPSTVWPAQCLFIDEIARARPDVQNKLFSLIHEKRVQGLPLERLIYRWAAMNPVLAGDRYDGCEPLDIALADRFALVVQMPGWLQWPRDVQRQVLLAQPAPVEPAVAARLRAFVRVGKRLLPMLLDQQGPRLADYLSLLANRLWEEGAEISPRRAGMMLRNLVAVALAASMTCRNESFADIALLTLQSSLPHPAAGQSINPLAVVKAHRDAWRIVQPRWAWPPAGQPAQWAA
jgi:MoxR-like ATPase